MNITPASAKIAAHFFVEGMVDRADKLDGFYPMWYGWALREAFEAGAKWQLEATKEPKK